jgi:hypothetical protein
LRRVGLARFLGGMDVLKRDCKLCERLTNLIATGWLVRRFVPEWQKKLSRGRKGGQKEPNTLEDDAKGAFTDLFPDTEVVTDDAGGGCGLRGMIRRRGYYMWGCHHESARDGKGKGGTKAGDRKERKGRGNRKVTRRRRKTDQYGHLSQLGSLFPRATPAHLNKA